MKKYIFFWLVAFYRITLIRSHLEFSLVIGIFFVFFDDANLMLHYFNFSINENIVILRSNAHTDDDVRPLHVMEAQCNDEKKKLESYFNMTVDLIMNKFNNNVSHFDSFDSLGHYASRRFQMTFFFFRQVRIDNVGYSNAT